MANFQDALKKGLEAYAVVKKTRDEIDSVFEDFQTQIVESATGLQVSLIQGKKEIKKKAETIIESPSILESVVSGLDAGRKRTIIPPTEYRSYNGMKISPIGKNQPSIEICEYELSPAGYPVSLKYANEYESCNDKISLEKCLERMLMHPDIGEKFQRMLTAARASSSDTGK